MNTPARHLFPLLAPLLLTACGGGLEARVEQRLEETMPGAWLADAAATAALSPNWLADLADDTLNGLVARALRRNFELAGQKAALEESRAAVAVSRAARLPALDLRFDAARQRSLAGGAFAGGGALAGGAGAANNSARAAPITNRFELGLNLNVELDLWGRLSAAERQSLLLFKAAEARYLDTRLRLATAVARAWYQVIAARQLATLFAQRLRNLETDADIIRSGYRRGINAALDVYRSAATLEQERARLSRQRQTLAENMIALETLLADYPAAELIAGGELPEPRAGVPAGLPSELLTRRPDLRSRWLELLAADQGLAVAHKQRFPRLSLIATGGDVSAELGALLSGSTLAWSLLGGLAQPLFDAGRLRALEEQARRRVEQAEQRYLGAVHAAFAEVEAALGRELSLRDRVQAVAEQERNAEAARVLSFEQYQSGLVSYTTVLSAQLQAFDAQSMLIELRNQRAQNRIDLYAYLGGGFDVAP